MTRFSFSISVLIMASLLPLSADLPSVRSETAMKTEDASCEIADIAWTLGPNLPEFRKGGCAAELGGNVISVFGMRQPWGEMDTMYVYDPEADWWSRGIDGPLGQTYVQGTKCGGSFYSIGGRSQAEGGVHTRCFRLSERNGKYVWDEAAQLNESRGWAPSASVDEKIYVFGGAKSGHGPTMNGIECLNAAVADGKWAKIGDLPGESRGWSGAASVGGKIYLIGGLHFFSPKPETGPVRKPLNEVLQFDPETAQWEPRSPLPYRLSGLDCCACRDRYIIVVGGQADTEEFTPEMKEIWRKDRFYESYYCPFVLVYDSLVDRWYRMPSTLPMPTNDIRVVLLDDSLYVLGGEDIEPATSNTTPWLRIGRIVTRETKD